MAELPDAHQHLLSLFRKPRSVGTITAPGWREIWQEELREEPSAVLSRFVKAGWLAPASIAETLECVMDVKALKDALQTRQQKLSGKKRDLVSRLLAADPEGCRALAAGSDVLVCTAAGAEIADRHEGERDLQRGVAEAKLIVALTEGRLDDALRIFADSEQLIDLYADGLPAIVGPLSEAAAKRLLIAASLRLAGLDVAAKRYLPHSEDIGSRLRTEVAVRMCVVVARARGRRRRLQEAEVKWVRVAGFNDGNGCSVCEALRGRKFRLSMAPVLPLADCTCEADCRCTLLMVERRWSLFR